MFVRLGGLCRRLFEYVWSWLGSAAAVALMLGVLAMGVHHVSTPNAADVPRLRCFAGVRNAAGAEPPQGITPLGPALADALPLPHVRVEYDGEGRVCRVLHLDAAGRLSRFPGSRVAEQRVEYDAAGRLVCKRNFNRDGQAVADASGVAVREFGYDAAGRLVRTAFFNASGVGVVPRMPGYAEQRIEYDAQGRPLRIRHLDAKGHALPNAEGEETVEYAYDDVHGRSERCNRVAGVPADNAAGFAVERTDRTHDGRVMHRVWLNAAGEAVANPAVGAVALLEETTASPGVQRTRLCGADGVMQPVARPAAEHLLRCDAAGHPEWECFNAADGLPAEHPAYGYAERVCEYSPAGHLLREYFWDASGNPTSCYRKDYTLTEEGEYVLSLFTDGSSELVPM